MLGTLWWWHFWDVGGKIIMLATFFLYVGDFFDSENQSPKSQIGRQHLKIAFVSSTCRIWYTAYYMPHTCMNHTVWYYYILAHSSFGTLLLGRTRTLESVYSPGWTMFWNFVNFYKILERGKSTNYIFENIFEPNNTPNCGRIEILRDCCNPFLRLDF